MHRRRHCSPCYVLIAIWILLQEVLCQNAQQQSFRVKPRDVDVIVTHDVILPCEVNDQKGQAQWTQDGFAFGFDRTIPGVARFSMLGNEAQGVHNLQIQNVTLDDDGEYQCQVTPMLPSPSIRAKAKVTVLIPPSKIEMVGHVGDRARMTVKAGDQITLECIAKDAKPAPKIEWLRGSEKLRIDQEDVEEDSSLPKRKNLKSKITITPSSLDNNVVYSCRTSHSALRHDDELSAAVTLDVQYEPGRPEISGYTEGGFVKATEQKTLTCRSRGGNPLPEVFWYKNGRQIDTTFNKHNSYTTNDYEFTVEPSDNNAKYECLVQNVMTVHPKKAEIIMRVQFSPSAVSITGPEKVNVGDTISLSCVAENSNPPADVSFLINGQPPPGLASGQTKTPEGGFTTIANVTGYVVGPTGIDLTVNCYAGNQPLGTTKVATKVITVLRPPSPPVIFGYEIGTILRKNEKRRLSCRSSGGNPLPDLKWFKGGKELVSTTNKEQGSSVSHLDLVLDMTDNGAEYRCEASNSATPVPLSNSTTLTVTYPPSGVKLEVTPLTPKSGEFATLTCITAPAFPTANVSWWRDGFEVEGWYGKESSGPYQGTISSYSTNISITADLNKKIFTCQADNGFSTTTHDAIILDVHFPPIIDVTQESIEIAEGETLYIKASAKGNPEPLTFTWRKGSEVVMSGGTINITKATREIAGVYTIEVSNPVGSSFMNVSVTVKSAPVITEVVSQKEINPGSRVALECLFQGSPAPEVEWKRPGYDMSRTETVSYFGKSELIIRNVTSADTGLFECHVKNEVGEAVMPNVQLLVNQKPEADESPQFKKAAAELGGTAQLICRVKASPAVHFSWSTRDHEPISTDIHTRYEVLPSKLSDNLYTYESILVVKDVKTKDHGFFLCQARNPLGIITTHIHLEGTTRPDPPIELKVLNVTHDSVHLTWLAGFNGGMMQTFRVRYHLVESARYLYMDVYPGNATEFWVGDLQLGSAYSFKVAGLNAKGESEYSDGIVRATTLNSPPLTEMERAISRVLANKASLPKVVTLAVSTVGGLLVIINVILVGCVLHRRRNKAKDSTGSSDKGSSKSTTIEMYAPSSYTGTVTGETLSSISEKSRESYANEDSADDYDVDAARAAAASTYLIEQLEPPPQYATRPPPHILPPPLPHNDLNMEDPYDENMRRNQYNAALDQVPGYGTLGRRGTPTGAQDPYNVVNSEGYLSPSSRYNQSYLPPSANHMQQAPTTAHAHPHYNGSLRRNHQHKLHFPKDYIRNGSMVNTSGIPISPTGNGAETSFSEGNQMMDSPSRSQQPSLSTFATDLPHIGLKTLPLEQRGHLV